MIKFQRYLSSGGQIPTFLVIFIALAVVMTLMVLNVGRVSAVKTRATIAASAAALAAASAVGGISRQYWELNDRKMEKCEFDWRAFVGFLLSTILLGPLAALQFAFLKENIFLPKIYSKLNKKLKGQDARTRLKEQAIFSAMNQTVDDPVKVTDDGRGYDPGFADDRCADLDEDGDATELVSRLAVAYCKRLTYLYEPEVPQELRDQVQKILDNIKQLRDEVVSYEQFLDNEATQVFEWVEQHGIDLTFWKPDPIIPPPDPREYQYIKKDAKGEKYCKDRPSESAELFDADEVEWISCEADDFDDFVKGLEDEEIDTLARTVEEWYPLLSEKENGFWECAMDTWDGFVRLKSSEPCEDVPGDQTWIKELDDFEGDPRLPSTCDPVVPDDCPAWTEAECPGKHPIDCLIGKKWKGGGCADQNGEQLKSRSECIHEWLGKDWDKKFKKPKPPPPPEETADTPPFYRQWRPIYSWPDKKGRFHHVRAAIGDFKLPKLKVKRNFFQACVQVKNATGEIPVAVTRYDQDRPLGRFWTMRVRNNPGDVGFEQGGQAPEDPDASIAQGIRSCVEAKWHFDYPGARIEDQRCSGPLDVGGGRREW